MKSIETTYNLLKNKKTILVDDDVYEWASKSRWHLDNRGYAIRCAGSGKTEYLHKILIDCPKGMHRDHINGNRLDNRRENLRIVTPTQNAQNRGLPKHSTTGYKGVYLEKGRWWRASIGINGKKSCIGYFKTAEDAARAYDKAAKEYYGEYARLNFE